jgi:hypothetical protein
MCISYHNTRKICPVIFIISFSYSFPAVTEAMVPAAFLGTVHNSLIPSCSYSSRTEYSVPSGIVTITTVPPPSAGVIVRSPPHLLLWRKSLISSLKNHQISPLLQTAKRVEYLAGQEINQRIYSGI